MAEMKAVRSRLVSVLTSLVLTGLVRVGVSELAPELAGRVDSWVLQTLELALSVGYAVLRARLRGAITAARPGPTRPPPSASPPRAPSSTR